MAVITVENLLEQLNQVEDKQAKVVIQSNSGNYDIDEVVLPKAQGQDYVFLAINDENEDSEE